MVVSVYRLIKILNSPQRNSEIANSEEKMRVVVAGLALWNPALHELRSTDQLLCMLHMRSFSTYVDYFSRVRTGSYEIL